MRKLRYILFFMVLWAGVTATGHGEWLLETQLDTAAYLSLSPADHGHTIVTERHWEISLGYIWRPNDDSYVQFNLPLRGESLSFFLHDHSIYQAAQTVLRLPRLKLGASLPTIWGPTGLLTVDFDLHDYRLGAELGLESTWDPLLTYGTFSIASGAARMNGGVIFAANKRWALGAHLTYRGFAKTDPSSALTYQVYYQSPQGMVYDISFTHILGQERQSLGLKLLF